MMANFLGFIIGTCFLIGAMNLFDNHIIIAITGHIGAVLQILIIRLGD